MRLVLSSLLLALAVSVSGGAGAGVKIPLSAAIAQCGLASGTYSDTIRGNGAEPPEQELVDRRFRSCVYAKSGSYPPKKPTKKGLSISGSAHIGLVYEF
ncbi:MAG: hypothetical protein GY952_17480 [Rhodobacteraceae bacterium]|nr:hypothetical protein [Paracoccaceae bacterium]